MANKEKKFLIVIGRQFGSGGRRIGKEIADRLGIAYYDRKLITEAARRMGYAPEIFERADEKRPSFLRSLLNLNYGATSSFSPESDMSSEGIYKAQSSVIKEICSKESCVIVGRTADYVMRDHPNMISIFLHAPMKTRIQNVMAKENIFDSDQAEDLIRKQDREREAYYNYFTNRHWGRADNYHLSVDSSRFDADKIIAAISHLLPK